VTLGGVDIPAGATVVIATPEVNRDPRHWPDPDALDLHRSRTPHLAFGHGVHQCLGQQLARIEMRIGLGERISRLPDLRPAVPAEKVPVRNELPIFGVHFAAGHLVLRRPGKGGHERQQELVAVPATIAAPPQDHL
jgi:cytochrome P450